MDQLDRWIGPMKVLVEISQRHIDILSMVTQHLRSVGICSNRSEAIRIAIELLTTDAAVAHVRADVGRRLTCGTTDNDKHGDG